VRTTVQFGAIHKPVPRGNHGATVACQRHHMMELSAPPSSASSRLWMWRAKTSPSTRGRMPAIRASTERYRARRAVVFKPHPGSAGKNEQGPTATLAFRGMLKRD
jgi:hypothetical protein